MKNLTIIFLLMMSATFSCTKSPEQKVRTAINKYMKANIGEYKSYDPIRFGIIDTAFNELNTEWEEKGLAGWKELRASMSEDDDAWMGEEYNKLNKAQIYQIDSSIRRYEFLIDSITKSYTRQSIGFIVSHTYRINKSGTAVMCSGDYYLNKSLDSVLYVKTYDCQ